MHPHINKEPVNTKPIKASTRTKAQLPFRMLKFQIGFRKVIYKDLSNNDNKLTVLFARGNILGVDQIIRPVLGVIHFDNIRWSFFKLHLMLSMQPKN
ncbi:hypothetical protein DN730_10520 [Marinomonas piezotolerans]|uniref:Transposase DDE domain-containing protein n=1 Tax=Marinomonas piezotolerans TaxID=2213058 RepID=A0A370U8H1_9GAMM|nr:hypothetical protein DN730_10520 [Marinomonas piezotolerans]